jgi:hypothetical protein
LTKAPLGDAHPHDVQASQQLACMPTHADPYFGTLHATVAGFTLHFVLVTPPMVLVWQHVWKSGLPHVECLAHLITARRHGFGKAVSTFT